MAEPSNDALQQDEARGILNHLLSDLPGVVYRCRYDEAWTMVGLTANVVELTGWEASGLVGGESPTWAELVHPDDREHVRDAVREGVEAGEPFRIVYRIETREGEERWVLEQGRAVEADGEEEGERLLTGYVQDVTEVWAEWLEKTEDDLEAARRERGRLELLQSVTQLANRERSLDEALAAALPEICRALSFRVGHVFLLDDDGAPHSSDIWHVEGDPEELAPFVEATDGGHWDPSEGLPGRVVGSLEAEWVEDCEADPGFHRVSGERPSPVRSGVGAPVVSAEEAIAVLELYCDETREAEPDVMELLEQVGIQLGRVWERQEADRAQRMSQQLFRQLAERGEMVFWVSDLEGEILYLSPGFQKLLGRDPDEDWTLEDAGDLLEVAHPEDRERLRQLFGKPDRAPYDIEYRILTPEAEVRWLHQKAFPIRDETGEVVRVGGLAEDVTELRRSHADLAETSRLLEQTFSSLDEAVMVIDTSGDGRGIVRVNDATERIFGWSREELVGGTTERLHPDRESFQRFAEEGEAALAEAGVFRAHYPLKRKDGTVFEAEQVVTLLDPERGLTGGAVSVVRDVSRREQLHRQLLQAQKMEAVGRLAGGIAHDFNNLLTVIRGQADFLLLDLDPESSLAEEIGVMRDAADRAARLTNQLLAFGREQVLRPRLVDPNRVVAGMDQLLRRVLGEDVQIVTELVPDPPPVRVDPNQLEQVIMNLALNARDAMPQGGTLTLSTEIGRLDEETARTLPDVGPGPVVRLVVSDTGIGMDEETRAQIFEPFFTTRSEAGGTGLGLSMTYGIVRQSGGTISVESEPGVGTTFVLCFPVAEGTPEALPAEASKLPDPGNHLEGRILVVEDDASVRRVARRILERAGLRVRTAGDTESARRILEEEGGKIDLLLTDLVLPGEGGRALVDECLEERPDMRLVVMSGYAEGSPGSRQDLPEAVGFIQKPFNPEGLVEMVRKKLGS